MPSNITLLPHPTPMSYEGMAYPVIFGFPSDLPNLPVHFHYPVLNFPTAGTFIPIHIPSYPQPRFSLPQRFGYPVGASTHSVSSTISNATSGSGGCDWGRPAKVLPIFDSDNIDESPQDLSFRSDVSLTVPGNASPVALSPTQKRFVSQRDEAPSQPQRSAECEMDLVAQQWAVANVQDDQDCADFIHNVKKLRVDRDDNYVKVRAALANNPPCFKLVPDQLLSLFNLRSLGKSNAWLSQEAESKEESVESSDVDHGYLRTYQQLLCMEQEEVTTLLTDGPDESLLSVVGLVQKELGIVSNQCSFSKMNKSKRSRKAAADTRIDDNCKQEDNCRKEFRKKLQVALASVESEMKRVKAKAAALKKLAKEEDGGISTVSSLLAKLQQVLSET